jgi:NTE family protein
VLQALFEDLLPELPPGFEFDIVSGTSVGAIHAAYVAASASLPARDRARRIVSTWTGMELSHVVKVSASDLFGVPLRALGLSRLSRRDGGGGDARDVVGGLVDLTPLERLVAERVPWADLPRNLARGRPGALCISTTEIRSGRVTVFMDGRLADPSPWAFDPGAQAIRTSIGPRHARASAAIPFLFPAVRLGDRYYVDGGLRMNTPLQPALRLRADRVLVVALKHAPLARGSLPAYPDEVITQPAFLLGKVLNALLLDQLEYELHRLELVNAWVEEGIAAFGEEFLPRINEAVRARRGVGYRPVRLETIRPSEDLGTLAAACYRRGGRGRLGLLAGLFTRAALRGVPEEEADLLSYLLFDSCFTRELVEMGRADALRHREEILRLLATP